jgi:regulator of cell morphogenesis and NO signaling
METEFQISQILQRYSLPVDKSLLYSYEELRRINIDQQFIYTLLRAFEDEKAFSEKEYNKFSLETIIDYVLRTHRYYLTKKLCEIEQNIHILLKDYSGTHPLLHILNNFFYEYTADLASHIREEEKHLLPYINSLLRFEKEQTGAESYFAATKNYSLRTFIDSHHDTEKDLSDVRNVILEYEPPATNQTPYRILITQLQVFEKDLSVHALIEDQVLIPRALLLEEKLNKFFSGKQN